MPVGQWDSSLGSGCYFHREDYVDLFPRLLIWAIDGFVIAVIIFAWSLAWELLPIGTLITTFGLFTAVWLYLVPLKQSHFGTLGYRLTGSRLVNLQGEPPSTAMLTVRMLLCPLIPSILVFDCIWSGVDEEGQLLRDRFTGQCAVKRGGQPLGRAPIHLAYYTFLGYTIFLPRVVRPAEEPLQAAG